jgi:uncharacterized spore protein YtfJ
LAGFGRGLIEADDEVVVVAHHTIGDELAKVGLREVVEQLDELVAVGWVVGERVIIGFGTGNLAEDVVVSISRFYFGAAISGHDGMDQEEEGRDCRTE